MVNLQFLVDDAKCFDTVRRLRWPEGVRCPRCESDQVARHGHDDRQPERQRYRCTACQARFDDLTDTIFAGHHQPLRVWVLCLYFMGLNLSNEQIAQELDLDPVTCRPMTEQLRDGIWRHARRGAGRRGRDATRSTSWPGTRAIRRPWRKRATGPAARLKGAPGRGTLAKEKPPIFGMIQRGGVVILHAGQRPAGDDRAADPGQRRPGTLVYTDEYEIYARLQEWGYGHKTVCHGRGEYARDEDGDGFCEVHVNTMEGFWSLLRSWLRPHRGISQEKLPLYLGFFEFVHNARCRGKALLGALLTALLPTTPNPE